MGGNIARWLGAWSLWSYSPSFESWLCCLGGSLGKFLSFSVSISLSLNGGNSTTCVYLAEDCCEDLMPLKLFLAQGASLLFCHTILSHLYHPFVLKTAWICILPLALLCLILGKLSQFFFFFPP